MKVYWIWLSILPHVGPVFQKRLIKYFRSPLSVYKAAREELEAVKGLNKRVISSVLNNRSLKDAETIAEKAIKQGIGLLSFDDPLYPTSAKICPESPVLLFYKGNLRPFEHSIAVVGSRRCTAYGRKVAEEIGKQLAGLHIPVVSGLAKGIDSYAHASCVQHGGTAIAFLAGGVDVCYPKEHFRLYHEILEADGAILSQYPPGTLPKPPFFLRRNALISAWSTELVVVEAGMKSGALWTAKFAVGQGKKIYAVPSYIHVPEGVGTNQLLAQGVEPYLGINSLEAIRDLKMECTPPKEHKQYNQILSTLSESSNPHTISSLSELLKINEQLLMNELFDLELNGRIIIRGNVVKKV